MSVRVHFQKREDSVVYLSFQLCSVCFILPKALKRFFMNLLSAKMLRVL